MLDSLIRLIVGGAYPGANAQENRRLRMLVAALVAITFAAALAVVVNVLTGNSLAVSLSVALFGIVIAANLPLLRLTRSQTVAAIFVGEQILLLALLTPLVGGVQPEFYIWYVVSLLLSTELVGRRIALPLAALYGIMVIVSQVIFQLDSLTVLFQAFGLTANPISRALTVVNALIATALIASAYESSRERAERQIAWSEQQLRQHLDNTPLAALTIAPTGRITSWNRSAEAVFGYTQGEAIGAGADLVLAGGLTAAERQVAIDELLASRNASNAITPNATKKGEPILCAWYHTPLFDAGGAFSGMACLALDITNQTRAAEELHAAKEIAEASALAKNRFLGTVSHEVRTPLNAIQGMTAALRDTTLTPEQQEMTAAIESGTASLLRLMNDVLDLSRLEAGAVAIASEPFSVRATVEDAVAALRAGAEAKKLTVTVHLDESIPEVLSGDRHRLHQILSNLLDNAIKFTERGGVTVSVSVRAATPEQYDLLFAVSDTGIGIDAGEFDRLFQSFGQLDTSSTRRYGGAGLGLAISRRLANLMGGDLWLESHIGVGSTFYCNILATTVQADAPPGPPAGHSEASQTGRKLSLLVVDDNVVNQKVNLNLIRKLGHDADVVDNGQAAVEAATRKRYDLILMDIHMPVMDGLEATRQILAAAPAEACPTIVALTAAVTAEDRKNALAAGMRDVLSKPIRLEELAESIMQNLPPQSSSDMPADRLGSNEQ